MQDNNVTIIIDPTTGLPETAADAARRLTNDPLQTNDARRIADAAAETQRLADQANSDQAKPAAPPVPGSAHHVVPDASRSPVPVIPGGAPQAAPISIATAVPFRAPSDENR